MNTKWITSLNIKIRKQENNFFGASRDVSEKKKINYKKRNISDFNFIKI